MHKYYAIASFLFLISCNSASAEKLIPFEDKKISLHGFKNAKGQVVIPAQFEKVTEPNKEEALIPVIKNGKFYRIDRKGHIRFESVFFDNGWDYYEQGLARFLKGGKVGFHDLKGNVIIKPTYDFASPFKDGYSNVCNGCWAEYEKPPRLKPLSSGGSYVMLQDQYLTVNGGKWGAINTKGEVVVPITHDSWEDMSEDLEKLKSSTK
jgi:hypothetical protein